MQNYYLAVDIGASSGRHMLGRLENGRMELEEIYRFENGMTNQDGKRLWDVGYLFKEILNGMRRCKELHKIPVSMSIDTWAVDYVLLDEKGEIIGDTYGYRDSRTTGMDGEVYKAISEAELYRRTGIQKQIFNTIYQLMAVKTQTPGLLEKASAFLMLPDYFQFLLTGKKMSEYTNATSTQLVNPVDKQWDTKLLKMLGYPAQIFLPLSMPGTVVGNLTEEIQKEVGFDLTVVLCASHDTASAVMAVPKETGEGLYISSGTWSLMGTEVPEAICTEDSRRANFTNEGGYNYRFRYLKNIMGLWMIQSVRHELKDAYSFSELCSMAEGCREFSSRIDVNHEMFLAPDSMIQAVKDYCRNTGQKPPESVGELCAVIYQSLAECYGKTVLEIEKETCRSYECIYVIGGGSNASYLNQLTADAAGRKVCAGPGEATAVGNVMAQMLWSRELENLEQARKCVASSFAIKEYEPL